MFLKNRMTASRNTHARIAFIASRAVTTGVEYVLAKKTKNVGNPVNKYFNSCSAVIEKQFSCWILNIHLYPNTFPKCIHNTRLKYFKINHSLN